MVASIIVTDAGIQEVINAEHSGTAPVVLTQVGLGTGQYTPSTSQTQLQNEFKRLSANALAGGNVGDDTIYINARDTSNDAYTLFEFGVYTSSGTLFAVCSQTTPILQKAAGAQAYLDIEFLLTNVDPASVTLGDTNFFNPPATTTTPGVVALATEQETEDSTLGKKAVTPKGLLSRLATALKVGLVKIGNTISVTADGTIDIKDSAVTTEKIADHAVTESKLELVKDLVADEDSLTMTESASEFSLSIKNGGVSENKIANNAVTTSKINNGAVTNDKLASNAVHAANILDESVETSKIKDDNVTTAKLAVRAVTTAKINDLAVTTAKIADANVTRDKLDRYLQALIPDYIADTSSIILSSSNMDETVARFACLAGHIYDFSLYFATAGSGNSSNYRINFTIKYGDSQPGSTVLQKDYIKYKIGDGFWVRFVIEAPFDTNIFVIADETNIADIPSSLELASIQFRGIKY